MENQPHRATVACKAWPVPARCGVEVLTEAISKLSITRRNARTREMFEVITVCRPHIAADRPPGFLDGVQPVS